MSSPDTHTETTGLEIAVVGLAVRCPGARNASEFWRNLREGVESIAFFTAEELAAAGVRAELLADPSFVGARGVLADAEMFDASFFGYNPREAELMDPQHRLFLECAWEALEDAGHCAERQKGRVGVYAGVSLNSYFMNLYANPDLIEAAGQYHTMIGNDKDFLTTRVSYKLNLGGPSVVVQSACSTSLVATHMACRGLLSGECDMALAGGVSLSVPQKSGYLYQEEGILSPDGRCRAFDERAQGTVSGNGVGIVVLKRLEDALSDGDHIRAVIKGSAVNNDGAAKVGYTAPGVEGQVQVVRAAQLFAEVDARTLGYVEAHGTGTALGDPVEVAALTEAFRQTTGDRNFCALGSVKTNIGHLDTAAGVAGLIKTVLALEHEELPPSLNFERPNPRIDFADSPFYVNARLARWERNGTPRRAGVSSFGLGGTNAHVILEEAPPAPTAAPSRAWQLLTLSARTDAALDSLRERVAEHLRGRPGLNLADAAYTLKVGRRALGQRLALVCRTGEEAAAALAAGDVWRGGLGRGERRAVFMFPGGGAQYANMGADLYRDEAFFRAAVDECAALLEASLGFDLRELLYVEPSRAEEAARRLRQTSVALPALFVTEYALARLLMSWGIRPRAFIGHSLGEYVAACLAGVFSLADALALVVLRGRLFERLPDGRMLSVSLPADEVEPLLGPGLSMAAVNAPALCVVSGATAAIEEFAAVLARREVEFRPLHIDVAAHSEVVTPILEEFRAFVRTLSLATPRVPFVSNVTGTWVRDEEARDPEYWVRHLRQTVRFGEGVGTLLREPDGVLLEVGPGQTLSVFARQQEEDAGASPHAYPTMRHPRDEQPDTAFLLTALAKLWLAGVSVDWESFYAGEQRRRVPLPTYPFERQRYWVEPREAAPRGATRRARPETGADIADWFYVPGWSRSFEPLPVEDSRGGCWLILADRLGVGAALAHGLKAEGREVFVAGAEDYEALLDEVTAGGRAVERVVHCLSLSDDEGFEAARRAGFDSLLALAQALDARGLLSTESFEPALSLSVVSNRLHAVTGAEASRPAKSTLLALCKVLPQEYLNLSCRALDVALDAEGAADGPTVAALLEELKSGAREPAVAYRGRQRWVQSFEPVRLCGPCAPWRERGVYLITGGMGGIGLRLARRLAERARARLVLVGRTPLGPREGWQRHLDARGADDPAARLIREVLQLEAAGAEVLTVSADVADEAAMRDALRQAVERFGTLDGVFHAAGLTKGRSFSCAVRELTREDVEAQFGPKVYGLRALSNALRERPAGFVVLFSSNAAVLGGLGFAAYSAANLYGDAFAARQSQTGATRWLSLNWDGWRTKAGADEADAHTSMARYAMRPDDALDALERVVASGLDGQVVVSSGDLDARLRLWLRREQADAGAGAERPDARADLHPRPALKTPFVAPSNEVERQVADIWRDLIGMKEVGVNDNFFELGGHSLLATRIVTRLRDTFRVKLPLRHLFESPTVAQLAAFIAEKLGETADETAAPAQQIVPRPRDGAGLTLSFAQQRLWFLEQLDPGRHFYNEPNAVRLSGELDARSLAAGLNEIVRRHEVLRTTFVADEDGQPLQKAVPGLRLRVPVVELGALGAGAREAEVRRLVLEDAARPFDLARGPLMRAALLRLGAREHVLMLNMHHIVSDAWSMGVLIRELLALYGAHKAGKPSPLEALAVQYADFAAWQQEQARGPALAAQLDYWRRQLAGAPAALDLPTDKPRPAALTHRGASEPFVLPDDLTAALKELGRAEGLTRFHLLLAGFVALLRRRSGQEDLVVGADVANRNRRETEPLIGFFVNMLALRVDLAGDPTFRELLRRVRRTTLEAYANQDLPFDRLVEELQPERNTGRSPLFQVVFNYYAADAPPTPEGLAITPLAFDFGVVRFELSLFIQETAEALKGSWRYNTELFEEAGVRLMHEQFVTLLRAAVRDPDARLSALEHDSEAEKEQQKVNRRELKRSNFAKFVGVTRKALTASEHRLVRTRFLDEGPEFPLVVEPAVEDLDLPAWAAGNRDFVEAELSRHGALLFRGFGVRDADEFRRFAVAPSGELLDYREPSSPRSELGGRVYTSTEYPADQWIQLHNEMSYSRNWPAKVFFCCLRPAAEGGETPLASSAEVFERLDPRIRRRFVEKRVMYARNFGGGLDLPWTHVFQTTDRAAVERYCRSVGMEYEWRGGDRLRTRHVCQSVLEHPLTGRTSWFNQAHAFHVSTLDPGVREILLRELGEEDLPRNAYYGDGSPIEASVIEEIRETYRGASVAFPWAAGDVLMLDNLSVAHGRAPFRGPRQILVAMSELSTN